jgi:hypothetical protein
LVTQNEPAGIVALTAQVQQILGQAQRHIEFTAECMIAGLSIGDVNELRGEPQPLPQFACASIGLARFRRRLASDNLQHAAQVAANFEFLSLASGAGRQQCELVKTPLNCAADSAIAERAADLRPALIQ